MTTKWLPLESNPEFLANLGVPPAWSIVDVISLEPELLPMVPKPVVAVLLLFPVEDKNEEFSKEVEGKHPSNIYYMKQTIKNACGTVALIHAVANNRDKIDLAEGSLLKKFIDFTHDMSAVEKGTALENDKSISLAHQKSANEGQTEAPSEDEDVDLHFVAFVEVDGRLYELDGRRSAPIDHGSTCSATLLEDACLVCKDFMARDPDNVRFTVVALTQQT